MVSLLLFELLSKFLSDLTITTAFFVNFLQLLQSMRLDVNRCSFPLGFGYHIRIIIIVKTAVYKIVTLRVIYIDLDKI